ncbi:pilus assembly protein PilO [Oscillatoriales cyanobacterium USR001]|nr:pilus assembly protein PilO [Oscillatoriales cyanobacterium USR001]
MTAANEFVPGGEGQEEEGGKALFGIKLTPQIQGGAIAVLGLLVAGGLTYQFVLPELQKGNDDKGKITELQTKQQQLQAQIKKKAQIVAARDEAKQRRLDVTSMFADDSTLNTLLFDMTQVVNKINGGIQADDSKAKLTKFEPVVVKPALPSGAKPGAVMPDPDIVVDGTLGSGVNGQLRRKLFKVEFEGNFAQTQAFLRNLELMQSLLVVKNLKSQLLEATQKIEVSYQQGKIVPVNISQPKIKTAFDLHALLPLKQVEPVATPSPAATASPKPAAAK